MIKTHKKNYFALSVLICLLLGKSGLYAQQESADTLNNSSKSARQTFLGPLIEVSNSNSTAAISTISGDVLYKTPTANLSNTLYGLLPGLTVLQGSGEPGNDAASLWIRGNASYNYGDYAVFVDGFQTTFSYFQYLLPSEIESVSILKDAAALATFGHKGANGVLWVVTKRGKVGKTVVQLQARTGFQQPLHINKPVSSYQYASLYNEAVSNDNGRVWSPAYNDAQLQAYKDGTGINTDWYDEVLKKQVPFTTADANFSGGSESARYFVMFGYMKSQGLYNVSNDDTHANAGLTQFNIRTNLDFTVFKIFDGKVDLGGRTEDRRYPNYSSSSLWNNLARYPNNVYSAKNDDGTWTGNNVYPNNPLASIRELGYNSTHDRTLQANFTLKERLDFITPGLYLSESASFNTWTRGSYNVSKNYARFIGSQQQTTDQNTNYIINDDRGTNQWSWNQFKASAGYSRMFGNNNINAAVDYLQYTHTVDANQNGNSGRNTTYAFQNIGGRFNYNYNDRYTIEFGFAYSGSDNYAKGNRFGFFPTLSGAWNISQEKFLKDNLSINSLKLRASAGKSAYDGFTGGRYLYQLYYNNMGSFPTGNSTPTWRSGIGQAYVPNPEIFSEESMKYNIGIDAKVFQKLDITLDAFVDKRTGIVTKDNTLMAVFGSTAPFKNLGKATSKGFEASANFSNVIGTVKYTIGGLVAYNTNKINYMAEVSPVAPGAAQTGRSIGAPFGYEFAGFYDILDFDVNGNLSSLPVPTFGAVQPGDIKYTDMNKDNIIDERDKVEIGNTFLPKLTYSFIGSAQFAGLDIRFVLQGISGRSVNLLDARNQTVAFENNGNAPAIAQNRWAYYPDKGIDTRATATYPRLSAQGNTNNYRSSTFWMKSGDYLRLRNIELGYVFPHSLIRGLQMSNVRIFVNAVNLFTMSSLMKEYNLDPETMSGYPALKSFTAGFTVNF